MAVDRRRIGSLNGEDVEAARELLAAMCVDDQCYEFAIAVARNTGLPLVGLWSPTACADDGIPGTWRHAAVRVPGGFFDARGFVGDAAFGSRYGEPHPWDVRDIGESDLKGVRPVRDERIATIAKLAQAAWPELPWGASSYQARMAAFIADLERLSRHHGVWVRAPYPGGRPLLAEGDGDEVGYRADLTDDGMAVVFDRTFDDQDLPRAPDRRRADAGDEGVTALGI